MIEKRQLGSNGPSVGCLGYGAMVLEGYYGASDDAQAVRTIRRALDVGMNMIDTADAYGNGHNEMLVGRAIAGMRGEAFVATKVSGPDFMAGATPALAAFVRELTRAVTDPKSGAPLHDTWAARFPDKVPEVATIVGATDYTAFQEHLGISCIDMHFGGPYGVYHSQYDNYFWMSRFGDPGFHYGRTLAQVWGLMAWRLAEAPLLPMRYSDYARAVLDYIARVEAHAGAERPLRLAAARAAIANAPKKGTASTKAKKARR